MTSTTSNERLKDIVNNGLFSGLLNYLEAKAIYLAIGRHAAQINNAGFDGLFGHIQRQAASTIVLTIGKIFDRDPRTRCVPNVVKILKKANKEPEFGIAQSIDAKLKTAEIVKALQAVKEIRNGAIAHNEANYVVKSGLLLLEQLEPIEEFLIFTIDEINSKLLGVAPDSRKLAEGALRVGVSFDRFMEKVNLD